MKKILLLIFVLMHTLCVAHSGRDKNYIVSDEETIIYRDTDPAAVVVGVVGGVLASIPAAVLYCSDGVKNFKPDAKNIENCVMASTPLWGVPFIAWGVYSYISNRIKKDKPLMRMNKEGFYYEGYGWHSWDQVGTPVMMEYVNGFRVVGWDILIPVKENGEYINLTKASISISMRKLLQLIDTYKPVKVPTAKQIKSYIPLKLQEFVDKRLEQEILDAPITDERRPLANCLKKDGHPCDTNNCEHDELQLDEAKKQELQKNVRELLAERKKLIILGMLS